MKYRLGLDIGIASVGWAVLEHDAEDKPCRIVDLGVRTFKPAEKPKDGSSLAVDRRIARGLRRRLRRRADRIKKAKDYLSETLLSGAQYEDKNRDVFYLRNNALDVLLSNEELCAVILYLIKHRGFKSNRKSETKEGEGGKLLKSIEKNSKFIEEKGYRTIGEAIYKDESFSRVNDKGQKEYFVRNHTNYDKCFSRIELEKELVLILQSQSQFGNKNVTNEFISTIVDLFNKQRSFDEGPNEPSKYRANFAVGKDLFEKEEYRAPKGSFTFEYFNALQKINHLTLQDGGKKISLTKEQVNLLLENVLSGKELTYNKIRKILNLDNNITFGGLSYFIRKKKGEQELDFETVKEKVEKAKFFELKFTKKVCKILGLQINKDIQDLVDGLGLIFSMRKSDDARRKALRGDDEIVSRLTEEQLQAVLKLDSNQIEQLLELETSNFGNLSFKSMKNICKYLEEGTTYDKACKMAGYDFNNAYGNKEKKKKIIWAELKEELEEVTSPVVLRSISQTIKVINAIVDKYGSPCAVFIEVAREMSKSFDERKKIKDDNDERQKHNEDISNLLKSWGIVPSGIDIVKYRLYEEQAGKCAYSGKSFEDQLGSVADIFINNNTQIDHIIPYSKCFDDSYNNKVLVLSEENQKKGNKLPFEYMSREQFESFEQRCLATYSKNRKKLSNLLKKSLTADEIQELNNRALNDTKHASRFVLNMLKNHLIFEESAYSSSPVRAISGSMTSYLRKVWGLGKNRFENDRHHAQDACVVACCSNHMINQVSKYLQYKYVRMNRGELHIEEANGVKYYTDEDGVSLSVEDFDMINAPKMPKPYEHFDKELGFRIGHNPTTEDKIKSYLEWGYTSEQIDEIKELFVSRMPNRGVKGAIHKDTLYGLKVCEVGKKYIVAKKDLQNLKFKDGEIEGYLEENKVSDPILYNALVSRIKMFETINEKGETVYDIKSAFAEPFYKPKADGTNGPLVKKIKIASVATDCVIVNNSNPKKPAVAENGSMIRVDIFEKDGKNYLIPVYVADAYAGILPERICTAGKPKELWPIVDDSYNFKFSVYPGDLVYLESQTSLKGKYNLSEKPVQMKGSFAYYVKTGISSAAMTFDSPDSEINFINVGMQNLLKFEKYAVDVLGNISRVKQEKRMPIKLKK